MSSSGPSELLLAVNAVCENKEWSWTSSEREKTVELTLANGKLVQIPATYDALMTLQKISVEESDANVIPSGCRVEIECPRSVEAVLPLWLRPSTEGGRGGGSLGEAIEEIEDDVSWAPYSADHVVFVNDEQWIVVTAEAEGVEGQLFCVPVRGTWYSEWFSSTYASFIFTETGSRTSGWGVSVCGLITDRVFAVINRFDEGETMITLRLATDPVTDLQTWVWSSKVADALRDTWTVADDVDDFIEWGLLQLAKEEGHEIQVWGIQGDEDQDLGVGLTNTSRWTFGSHLSKKDLRAALGEMLDRRPGTGEAEK